ncbi:MAG: hypothetical protein ACHQX3_12185 [Nitrospirales bacterium]
MRKKRDRKASELDIVFSVEVAVFLKHQAINSVVDDTTALCTLAAALADLAHEMGTPIEVARGMVGTIYEDACPLVAQDYRVTT